MHAGTLRALAGLRDGLEAHFAAFAPEFVRWAPPSGDTRAVPRR